MRRSTSCTYAITRLLLLSLLILTAAASFAEDKDTSQLDQVVGFLTNNVIGKNLVAPQESYLIDDGKIEAVFGGSWIFSNLKMTATGKGADQKMGFTVDVNSSINMTKYKLDSNGKRIEPPMDSFERQDTKRYYVTERKSTGGLFGIILGFNPDGSVQNESYTRAFQLKLADGKLVEETEQLFYDDISSADSKTGFEPGAYESVTEYYLNPNGKLESKTTFTLYSVDPATMKRSEWKKQPGKSMVRVEK